MNALRRQYRSAVMLCTGMVDFMDGNGIVHNFGSDGLLVDDGLDGLVNVVMDMFSFQCGCRVSGMLGVMDRGGVLELSCSFL